jgi:hypothetical protein
LPQDSGETYKLNSGSGHVARHDFAAEFPQVYCAGHKKGLENSRPAALRSDWKSVVLATDNRDTLIYGMTERFRQAIERAAVVLAPEQQDEFADRLLVKLAEDESGVAES